MSTTRAENTPSVVLHARRTLVDAMHAMHADQRIVIDAGRAATLEEAWKAYDATIRQDEYERIRGEVLT